jgi:SAM-dependent methyltransferase
MDARPAQLTPENAARFQDRTVVDRYHLRLPYPPEIFDVLVGLIDDAPRDVLDAGAGTGEIARVLADRVDRVDAVDLSGPMIAKGKTMPGGDHPRLRWIQGRLEDVPIESRYALITAGDSLHWMEWEVVMPRFQAMCTPQGMMAIVHRSEVTPPWQDGLGMLIAEYSTMQNFEGFDLIAQLEQRRLFTRRGSFETAPVGSRQSIDDYVESFHSRSSLSRENMPVESAAAFDRRLRELVEPYGEDGAVDLQTVGTIEWGLPLSGA